LENIESKAIEDQLEKVSRRLDSIQKQLDLLYADREILETIQGRLTSVEEQIKLSRQHDNEVRKDIKDEIQISGDRVVAKVEDKLEKIEPKIKKKLLFWKK
jgi:hypothetical protein